MHTTHNSLPTSALATATRWAADATTAQRIGAGIIAAASLAIAWTILRNAIRALRTRFADDDAMDPFTAAVSAMATALSIDGMWTVFGALHLVTPARAVSCGVLEAAGFAFMRQARRDIQAGRPATKNTAVVWAVAVLSGVLSAGASKTVLEAVVRLFLPSLAVELCHSWMLPTEAEITLTQRQKGRRAWRYVKANRRLQRAKTPIGRAIAGRLLAVESDRLAKRSLMTGDASTVLQASEKIATAEALSALGITPDAAEAHWSAPSERVQKRAPRTPARHAAKWSDSALRDAALDIDAQAIALTGAKASARHIARELRLGHARARELRAWIDARPSTP